MSIRALVSLSRRLAGAAALVLCLARPAAASQADLLPWREDVNCAPTLTYAEPASPLRLIGTTDVVTRLVYGSGQTVVVGHVEGQGVEAGQLYYVRRLPRRFGEPRPDRGRPAGVHTAGWVRIREVSGDTATAAVVRACDGLLPGDYLEPFSAPRIARRAGGTLQLNDLATVLGGDEQRPLAGAHETLIVDRGADGNLMPGDTFVVFREKRGEQTPPAEVGEGVVLVVQPSSATIQITRSRDAVMAGDRVAFRR
jgi:hypothetical protein